MYEAFCKLLQAAKCALADLEGVMPHYDPDHQTMAGWDTIAELQEAIAEAECIFNEGEEGVLL